MSYKRDKIHEKYIKYLNLDDSQKNLLPKTHYTYAFSFTYRSNVEPKKRWEWKVPNMSRPSVHSFTNNKQDHNNNRDHWHKEPSTVVCNSRASLEPVFTDEEDEDEDEEETFIKRIITNLCRTTKNTTNSNRSFSSNHISNNRNKRNSKLFYKALLPLLLPLLLIFLSYQYFNSSYCYIGNENQVLDKLKVIEVDLKQLESKIKKFDYFKESLQDKVNDIKDLQDENIKNVKDDLEGKIDLITKDLREQLNNFKRNYDEKTIEQQKIQQLTIEQQIKQELLQNSKESSRSLNVEKSKKIREDIYDSDKTGHEYDLETAGGEIIESRCSQTFDINQVHYRFFGITLWTTFTSPRVVIQSDLSPGQCWAFKGNIGHLVFRLSQIIIPTLFSYEHIPKQFSTEGNINSAPKEFQVRGLDHENDQHGRILGNYVYQDNNKPMQYFMVKDSNPRPYQFIQLIILSNHGHNDYTCLYRFRVHGKRISN